MAIEGINFNSLSVDENGRASFSGLTSGINFREVVDAIIAARSIPIDQLEIRITESTDKITALQVLKTNLSTLRDSLANLYGAVTFGDVSDIFEGKNAFATASRLDGATPGKAADLIGITLANAAAPGTHSLEVLRTAKAHKVSSDKVTSTSTTLGLTEGNTFTVGGRTITVSATDSLADLRDRFNSANSGTSASGVTASIVSVSTTEHYLVLTKDKTGTSMTLTDTSGTPLQTVGLLDSGAAIKNALQAAQTAQFYADGILDSTDKIYESSFQTASTVQVGSTGQLNFGATYGNVSYSSSDTLATLATNITAAHADLTATVVTDGTGVRLEIVGLATFTITENLSGTAIGDLGIDNKRLTIERDSNTIDDLFTGVTLNLFQAEKGTTLKIDVERDLNAIKTEISSFVDAYNELRIFINSHRLVDTSTGEKSADSDVLFNSRALSGSQTELSKIIAAAVDGIGEDFSIFAQIGIAFAPFNGADPLQDETLVIDETKLDAVLLNNIDDVRKLFTFEFTSGDARVKLIGFDGNTTYNASGYTLNIQPNSGENLFQYSEQFDNAYWTKSNVAVTANAATAPNSTTTAEAMVADAVSTTHSLSDGTGISVTTGESYIFTIYAKEGDKTGARLSLSGGFGPDTQVDFNINAGTILTTGDGIDEAEIESVGSGWYRLTIKATATSTATATAKFNTLDGSSDTFAGDASTVSTYVWGAQFENVTVDTTVLTEAGVTASGAAIGDNVVLGPDGATTDGDSLTSDGTSGPHYVAATSAISVTSGKTYDYVAFVKAGAQPRVRLEIPGSNFAANTYAEFDISGGSVTATGAGATSASIIDAGGGWYRITVTADATATGTEQPRLYSMDVSNNLTYTASTLDTYFWDQRLIEKSSAGSYVVTASSSVTGATATANIDGTADGLDDGSATIVDNTITINTGSAKGLVLFFSGFTFSDSMQLDFTVGVAAKLYNKIGELIDVTTGIVEAEIDSLTDQNKISNDRITEMKTRLDIERDNLLDRFIAMEVAIAQANRIMDTIRRITDAVLGT